MAGDERGRVAPRNTSRNGARVRTTMFTGMPKTRPLTACLRARLRKLPTPQSRDRQGAVDATFHTHSTGQGALRLRKERDRLKVFAEVVILGVAHHAGYLVELVALPGLSLHAKPESYRIPRVENFLRENSENRARPEWRFSSSRNIPARPC
jgi:hypothetical protein